MHSNPGQCRRKLLAFATGMVWLSVWLAVEAQMIPFGQFKDFALPEYHPPPHEGQIKTLVRGAEAIPQDDGGFLIKQLRLETFRVDGTAEFVLKAEDCLYNTKRQEASSAEPLAMETADGRFSTVGVGFLWREDESVLTISNRVHTVIHTGGKQADER